MTLDHRAAAAALLLAGALGACATAGRGTAVAESAAAPARGAAGPARDYLLYTTAESADEIARVRFGPAGARVERTVKTGLMPAEINGPHGVAVAPDGRHYYVTVAHGTPFGTLWKYATDGDSVVGRVTLGMFPATVQVSPDGAYAYVANFNVHGDMVPSSVSVVATEPMLEIARIRTCTMPHGSRFNPQGTRHYSTCMMDDVLVEIDTRRLGVSRHFVLAAGRERGVDGAPGAHPHGTATCSPTWAQPSSDGSAVFVACNKSSEIVEIDADSWTLRRRLAAGPGVYNLAVTRDGRLLLGTNKRGQSVSVFDLASGRELARIPTRRKVVHGVVVSPDDRYAFVSVEGIGSEPGTVEVIDLRELATVATVDVGQQAGGLDVWRVEETR